MRVGADALIRPAEQSPAGKVSCQTWASPRSPRWAVETSEFARSGIRYEEMASTGELGSPWTAVGGSVPTLACGGLSPACVAFVYGLRGA